LMVLDATSKPAPSTSSEHSRMGRNNSPQKTLDRAIGLYAGFSIIEQFETEHMSVGLTQSYN